MEVGQKCSFWPAERVNVKDSMHPIRQQYGALLCACINYILRKPTDSL